MGVEAWRVEVWRVEVWGVRVRAPPPSSTSSQRSALEGRTQRKEMGTKMAIVYPYMHSTSASFLDACLGLGLGLGLGIGVGSGWGPG